MTQIRCAGCGKDVPLISVRIASITRGLVDLYHGTRSRRCGPVIVAELQANKPHRIPRAPTPSPRVNVALVSVQRFPLREAVRELELQAIRWALDVAGNQRAAASLLGIQRTTLNNRLRRARLHAAWPEAKSTGVMRGGAMAAHGAHNPAFASSTLAPALDSACAGAA